MNSTKLRMTAQYPSTFGMPIGAHAFGVTTCATEARTGAATTLVVRDRVAITGTDAAIKGDMDLAQSDFPGTSAWRPPIC